MQFEQLLIKDSIDVLLSLANAIENAGGSSSSITYKLDKPLGEFLEICIRNRIGFVNLPNNQNENENSISEIL
jgi:hypothetical protein